MIWNKDTIFPNVDFHNSLNTYNAADAQGDLDHDGIDYRSCGFLFAPLALFAAII